MPSSLIQVNPGRHIGRNQESLI